MTTNPFEPPKELGAARPMGDRFSLATRAFVGFLLGSAAAVATEVFLLRPAIVPLPPQIHFPIYWLWVIVPVLLGIKGTPATLAAAVTWGIIGATLALFFRKTRPSSPAL